MEAIKTVDLTKRYKDVVAVDGLALSVEAGELFALLGVNGAGKTTAIKMLCGLIQPDGGEGYLLGNSIRTQRPQIKRLVGISPQETAVAPNLTVEENLALMAGVYGLPRQQQKTRIGELLSQLGLDEVARKRAGKLSGGWQRRLSIAMALVGQPQILFLDEPTLGMDVLARAELWEMIRKLKGSTTVILTTHYMEEAHALADRIGIMKDGRLLTVGTAGELMERTGTTSVEAAFIAIVRGDNICG